MKSLRNHLRSVGTIKSNLIHKPVSRASAIFPFVVNEKLDTNILFMGYWFIKRKIENLKINLIIRKISGAVISSESFNLKEPKAYRISLKKKIQNSKNFYKTLKGSIEIEIFSKENLVYPFPALVVNYTSNKTSSVVHTCGRTFNNLDDQKSTLKFLTPETGFDILPGDAVKPFIAFVNGNKKLINKKISFKILSQKKEILKKSILLKNIRPYETKFLFFLSNEDKKKIVYKSSVVINHQFNNFFPRFLAGNFKNDESSASITHTYYDLSKFKTSDNYNINKFKKKYFDSYIAVPIFLEKNLKTELAIYPNTCIKSPLNLSIQIYDKNGKMLDYMKNIYKIEKKFNNPLYININDYLGNKKNLSKHKELHCRLSFSTKYIPLRQKVGLNIIRSMPNKISMPSNVCFNTVATNHLILNKKSAFRWCPILNQKNSSFIVSNISNLKGGFRTSKILLKFWREKDNRNIEKNISIKDNGFYWFKLNKNKKIKNFLEGKTGWVTISSNNPFVDGFYFEDCENGHIAADHLF